MAYDAARNELVAFGGTEGTINAPALAQTLVFDGEFWRVLGVAGPPARTRAAMAYDAARGVIVLHGGLDAAGQPLRDTWTWDGKRWTPASTGGPAAKGHVLVYDPAGARCLAAPGNGEVWAWDGAAWSLVGAGGPETDGHSVAFDTARGRLVCDRAELYKIAEWDGAAWHIIDVAYGRNVWDAAMVYDPRIGRCVRAGGIDSGDAFIFTSPQTWEWDGQAWRIAAGLSIGRTGHAMAWDPDRQRVVCFGGSTPGNALADTWSSVIGGDLTPHIIFPPDPATRPAGGSVGFDVATTGAWFYNIYGPEAFEWSINGVVLRDGPSPYGTVSGATTAMLGIQSLAAPAEGEVIVRVSNACGGVQSPAAALDILCPADMTAHATPGTSGYANPNGVVNNEDFFFYLSRFAAGSVVECDLTTAGATTPGQPGYRVPDGVLDRDDFLIYLALLAEGC
jgi:hypothetical protein